MASVKYLVLLCMFSCVCRVKCNLNLSEGSPCVTDGYNGTCVGIHNCETASLTYAYANAGFDLMTFKLPELPDICSIKDNELVVCCTDCGHENATAAIPDDDHLSVEPLGSLYRHSDQIAKTKCIEYFQRLPYPCRGQGNIEVKKYWHPGLNCHQYELSILLATGGRPAARWEFPHSALIGYGADVESAQWLCGGSVISERFILTAAHCSSTRLLGNISFAALGLLKRSDPSKYWKIHKIKRIIMHPEYKSPSKYHDIALLETETEINFGKDLLPACLDTSGENYYWAEASGWGRLGSGSVLADTLQTVNLMRFEETECATIYQPHRHLKHGYDHEKQMCYGSRKASIDTCEGDSGGPLQTDEDNCLYTILGVTSYGKDCGIIGSAGIYTRVSYYVPWIEGIVWPEAAEAQRKKDIEWLDKLLSNKR